MINKVKNIMLLAGRPVRRFFISLVLFYQNGISIMLPQSCRFVPSCSNYALEVLHTQPLIRSLLLIIWRLLRCQPLCKAGFDPAPEARDLIDNPEQKFKKIG